MTARLLAVIATIAGVAALRATEVVTLPLALGAFLLAVTWPLQAALERRVPRWMAVVCTVLAVLLVGALLAGALITAASRMADAGPRLAPRLQELSREAGAWAQARNLTLPFSIGAPAAQDGARPNRSPGGGARDGGASGRGIDGATDAEAESDGGANGGEAGGIDGASAIAAKLMGTIYSVLEILGLAFAFLVLGLLEVRDFQAKVRRRLSTRFGEPFLETLGTIAAKVRRHLLALSITCLVSGAATGLYALVIGLDLAFFWGLLAFLLNYIPTLGPLVAVVPPTLFALLQFDGLGRPAAVLAGIGAIQFFIGNFVDPKIEGRVLSLSPLLVLFAIVFWGWVWGVFGAFLAVPLTATILIVCDQFASTRWIAALLTGSKAESDG